MEIEAKVDGKKIGRAVDIIPIEEPPVQYVVYVDGSVDSIAGYCIVTATIKDKKPILHLGNYKVAALWHIHVEQHLRNKGYGTTLIKALQATFHEIYTQALTPEGNALLANNGFYHETRGGVELRVWRK